MLPLLSAQTHAHNQHLLRNRKHALHASPPKTQVISPKLTAAEVKPVPTGQPTNVQSLRHKRRRRFNPTLERTSSQEAYLAPLQEREGRLPAARDD